MTETFASALAAANDLYAQGKNADAAKKYGEALKLADDKYKLSTQLSRARAYFRLGKYSRALSDCSEVLGSRDAALACPANQLKGECFLREVEFEGALEAFQLAKQTARPGKATEAIDAFIAATEKAAMSGEVDFAALQPHSAAASAADRGFKPPAKASDTLAEVAAERQADAADAGAPAAPVKPFDPQAQAHRVASAMARAGPSVRAEDLSVDTDPFAGHVPLEKPSKYRMQYNQNAGGVEVQVFAKRLNTQPERVTVAIEPRRLRVEIRDEANAEAEYTLEEELYHEIDPAASSHKILGTQVLIKLRKVDGAVSWPSLGKSDVPVAQGGASIVDASAGPAREYPTSSKKQHRDWDKLESEARQEEKEEKLDGEAGLQKFFKQLYGDLDEDSRRAMNKSFQESGGTTLSTNWKDIGAKKLTCEPPEGVKVKTFEQ